MEKLTKALILSLLLASVNTALAGGGWLLPKGKGYFKLSEWWVVADQHFTDQGKIDPNVTMGIFNTSVYAEYGISDRLNATLYMPIFSRATINNLLSGTTGEVLIQGDAINGLGDADVSLKYRLNKPNSKWAVAGTLTLGLPIGISAGGREKNLQTGDGEFNQILRIDASRSFGKDYTWYSSFYAGLNNRTQGFSDEIRYGAEVGKALASKKLWVIGRITGIKSLFNGETAATAMTNSIFANNTEFASFGLEGAYYLKKNLGITAGAAGAFYGKIILAAPSYTVGVFAEF